MISPSKYALSGLVIAAMVGFSWAARAQSSGNDVARGYTLWRDKSCDACHSIGGGRRAGPDLKGVTDRRSRAWLNKWLTNTREMLQSDSTAMGLLADYHNIPMPEQRLSPADINALLAYISSKSQ
jgi:mono/diheme cytochrome c family protein